MARSNRHLKILFFGLICTGIACFFLDHPLGKWLQQNPFYGEIHKIINCGEWFGYTVGTVQVLLAVYVLDRANRRKILRVAACSLISGLAVMLVKMVVCRVRPKMFDFSNTIDQTFTGLNFFTKMSSVHQSFPSGHTAAAVGLALGLSWLYPHGRKLFAFLAAWVALQRLVSQSHYLSDTICGAMIGFLIAEALLPHGPLAGWFDRFESNQMTNDK